MVRLLRGRRRHTRRRIRVEADLDLEGFEALGDCAFDLVCALVWRFRAHPVARFDAIAILAADEVVDRLVGGFADNVPEGLVDGSGDVEGGGCAGVEEVTDLGCDLAGKVHAAFDGVDVVRVAADQAGLDLFEEALVAAGADAGFADAGDALVGIDEDDGLDGGEAGAVPHGDGLVFAEGREGDADVAGADVGDFHRLESAECSPGVNDSPRVGSSSSIPPIGSTMARIFRTSSLLYLGSAPNACDKISRVSRWTVLPLADARSLKRVLNSSLSVKVKVKEIMSVTFGGSGSL